MYDTCIILKDKYFSDAKNLSKEEFCRIYKYPFLIRLDESNDINLLIDTQSPTISTNSKVTLEDILSNNYIFNSKNIVAIHPIVKTRNNPFIKKITVGRASIHDIIIKEPTISKFHAYFQVDEEQNYYLVDNDSTNGTKLNDKDIASNNFILLKDSDKITFSNINFMFYKPSTLYEILKDFKNF